MHNMIERCVGKQRLVDAFQPIMQLPVYVTMSEREREVVIQRWQDTFVNLVTPMLIALLPEYARPRVWHWQALDRPDLIALIISEHIDGLEGIVQRELMRYVTKLMATGTDVNL
jgi:hypothetical protein